MNISSWYQAISNILSIAYGTFKKQSGYTARFHRIFGMCQQELGGRLLREQIFFQGLQAGDGIERILAYLDNNILIAIPTAERFRD